MIQLAKKIVASFEIQQLLSKKIANQKYLLVEITGRCNHNYLRLSQGTITLEQHNEDREVQKVILAELDRLKSAHKEEHTICQSWIKELEAP